MKRKFYTFLFAFCLVIPAVCFFTGCSCNDDSTSVVSIDTASGTNSPISANGQNKEGLAEPLTSANVTVELELIVDSSNKVIAVNPQNTNADEILANLELLNTEINTAVNSIIENCLLNGSLKLTGSSFNVDINGGTDALKSDIETKIKNTISSVEAKYGLDFNDVVTKLQSGTENAKNALIDKLETLAPEMTATEMKNMTEEELMEKIKEKAVEFNGMTSSDIQALQTRFDSLVSLAQSQLDSLKNIPDGFLTDTQRQQIATLEAQLNTLINQFKTELPTKIQEAKNAYATAKANFKTAHENAKNEIKATLNAKLQSVVDAGNLTQEQMNAWTELFNKQN